MRRIALVLALAWLTQGAASAHDSWLSPAPGARDGTFELSTGNRFPVQEFGSTPASLALAECADGAGRRLGLRPGAALANRLELQAEVPLRSPPPLACWIELKPQQVEIRPALVQVYLDEIRAGAPLREAWATMQARGIAWRETYRKFARIERDHPEAAPQARALARLPAGLGLEIVLLGDAGVAIGQPLEFQVLRDGQPLAGLPVELVSERSALGIWRTADAQGKLRWTLPFAGRWLLRATELQLDAPQDRWTSRFVTLAIEAR